MKKMLRLFLITTLFLMFSLTAGNSVFAALDVNVMPSGSNSQTNIWDSKGPYTWPGNNLELWGNVSYDGVLPLTYTWTFGAGEGSVTGAVGDWDNISVTHNYLIGGSYIATLTVTDGTESDTDTVFIDVVPQTPEVEVNLAIQKGLKYLYLNRHDTFPNGIPAHYWTGSNPASTAMAVLAFQNHGHLEQNDQSQDIYAHTTELGLNYLFNLMRGQAAANTVNTNSDINNNTRSVYCNTNNMYHVGMTTMAIAGSANPTGIVGAEGSSEVVGKTYLEVLEDMVDYIAWAQGDTAASNMGWRYSPNYGTSDNSVAQWPLLGLGEASRAPWNISAPAWVKTKLTQWINYSQRNSPSAWDHGGFGYTVQGSWSNVAKTGAGVAMMAYTGAGGSIPNAIDFLDRAWNMNTGAGGTYNISWHYAMYAVKKGMEYANLSLVGTYEWQEEYNQWYVDHQLATGTWNGSYWVDRGFGDFPCSFGLLVLAPLEVCKPLADAGPDLEGTIFDTIDFDGSGSSHTCPDQSLVNFEWDFDYDGTTFDVDDTGVFPTNLFSITNGTDTQLYSVALRVTDDQDPSKEDIDTLVVTVTNGNVAPVADPGGPYLGGVGADIVLDGSGSYDDNAAGGSNPIPNVATGTGFDEIVLYQWDIDGDGLYGSDDPDGSIPGGGDPEGVTPTVNFGTFIGTKTIGLKVTDSFGKSAAQSSVVTTVAVTDLFPVSYELISNRYNRRTRQWTVTWKMNIMNAGNADATAVTAVLTPDSIPVGVTVNDDSLAWTLPDNVIEDGETQLSDDTFQYTYPRGAAGPDLTVATWDIQYTDDGGTQHIVRSIPQ